MLIFQSIAEQAGKILELEQGVFLGVDHDDIFFHEYLVEMLINLSKKHPIHFLLEQDNNVLQANLVAIRTIVQSNMVSFLNNNGISYSSFEEGILKFTPHLINRLGIQCQLALNFDPLLALKIDPSPVLKDLRRELIF